MKRLAAVTVLALVFILAGCGAPEPVPTVTVTATVTATPAPAPTVTVTVAPEAAAPPTGDRLAALQAITAQVVAVDEVEPGRWEIATSIIDPRGGNGTAEAAKAIAVCEEAVRLGATYVSVMEGDGSTFVLYGHPSYGNMCTEV